MDRPQRPTGPYDTVRRVRVSKEMDARVRADARLLGISESEAMRLGLDLVHRLAKRRANIGLLLQDVDVRDGPKPGFR